MRCVFYKQGCLCAHTLPCKIRHTGPTFNAYFTAFTGRAGCVCKMCIFIREHINQSGVMGS